MISLAAAALTSTAAGAAGVAAIAVGTWFAASRRGTEGLSLRRLVCLPLLATTVLAAISLRDGASQPAVGLIFGPLLTALVVRAESSGELVRSLSLPLVLPVLATQAAPGPATLALSAVAWGAVLFALAEADTLGRRGGARPTRGASRGCPSRRRTAALVGAGTAAAAVLFVLLPAVVPANSLAGRQAGAGGAPGGLAGLAGLSGPSRTAEAYATGRLDMRVRGTLGDRPMLLVPSDSPALWRGSVLDSYDGLAWSAAPEQPQRFVAGTAPAGSAARSFAVEVADDARFPVIIAPGEVLGVESEDRLLLRMGGSVRRGWPMADRPYAVTSALLDTRPERLRAARGPDPEEARWTALPSTLPARVVDLGRQLTGPASSRYDAVLAVERDLRARARYDLDSRVPEDGEDAVDAFLFRDREGFCEHFAAAAVVLLRAAGIPARMATGFAAGAPTEDGTRRLLRSSDAHAWVEVWYPGIGWVASDPTAGAARADTRSFLPGRTALLWTGAALAVAVLLALLVREMAKRRRRRGPRRATVHGPPPAGLLRAFARVEQELAADGRPRAPSESVAELAWRVRREAPAAAAGLRVLERLCYSRIEVPSAEVDEATAALTAYADHLAAGRPAPPVTAGGRG